MLPLPTQCPECGEPVVQTKDSKSGIVSLWCNNKACPGPYDDVLKLLVCLNMGE
jgi:NAD-dependent DNA ligase